MKLHITHVTRYHYTPVVDTALHVAYLKPEHSASQTLLAHELHVEPAPAQTSKSLDVYGNARTYLAFNETHASLQVTASSTVQTSPPGQVGSTLAWESARERFRFRAGGRYDPATEFIFASPFAAPHADFLAYALPSFAPGTALLPAVQDLMERIYTEFDYAPLSTEIDTPARQALVQRQGVCQDFAHIMIACLRSLGLPARYVSGYLLTEPPEGQERLVGSDASHAWISVYVPAESGCNDSGASYWVDFDPTNNRWGRGSPGADYVRLACGRDYGDISPLRGVIYGGAQHTLDVEVTVSPC
ncbi:MAG: transglutaminase N-terminal domain-containing protein [Burkholderiaceae bacterium]